MGRNKKKKREYDRKYRLENKEIIKARAAKYYLKTRNKILEQRKKWRLENREKHRNYYIKRSKKTIDGFLTSLYLAMERRVEGRHNRSPHLWAGKSIMSRETFFEWSRNHPTFLKLFKRWNMCNHDRKFTPSINRIDSRKGYTLDNVEWITTSQNCSLAGTVKSVNKRTAVYSLLEKI